MIFVSMTAIAFIVYVWLGRPRAAR
ncbi:hypothetical protein SEA_OBLADI_157 [Gordonia phage ObLaDi]|uniref:Membrane protein n=2 Tax=Cafassovirus TaxID=3425056 RepID=A0A9E7TYG3_9CAUD|nr:membrane protein [Gordonia phage Aleemily]UXE03880.1 hypothetical protein SEA_OBLADI_157 [Gordonia phage ObLaDi]